jgi:Uma2 family endonuclease
LESVGIDSVTTITPTQPSTMAERVRTSTFARDVGDQRITIRGLDWFLYDRLSDAIGEGQHIRLAYDGKDLEIMTTGRLHEDYKGLFGRLINAVTFELGIPSSDAGETTWKRPEVARGLEADQCYYFLPEKLAADADARARKSNDVADYPNPDLAIEIDISPSELDRATIYAALRITEVWRFDGETMVIEQLAPDGSYVEVDSSRFLPIRADEVVRWLVEEDVKDKLAWERRLRAWIRTELAPRNAGGSVT